MTVRVWLRVEGFSLLALSVALYWISGLSWWMFFALLLTPDLALLAYLINPRVGSAAYNFVHSYFWPLSFAAAAAIFGQTGMLPYLYIWGAHIGLDRCLGYGLKYPTSARLTHLGNLAGAEG